jgi:hypothetical protein
MLAPILVLVRGFPIGEPGGTFQPDKDMAASFQPLVLDEV